VTDAVPTPGEVYVQRFSVPFEYPVQFTRRLFDPSNPALAEVLGPLPADGRPHRMLAFLDAGVAAAHPKLRERIAAYARAHAARLALVADAQIVPGGEAAKNDLQPAHDIIQATGEHRMCRHSYLMAIGGGAVLDLVGFATSLVHRGLRFVRVPTTVLAQNDAGIGIKNAMNFGGVKNFIGTFAPPFAVLNDATLLTTLADDDWRGGIAEALKVAIIKDAAFFDSLCAGATALRDRDLTQMETLIRRCAILHLDHIRTSGDPFEAGAARPLDFGHWAAHKVETLSDYRIGHGQGVAIGIALDSHIAAQRGLISDDELGRILTGLESSGLPTGCDLLSERTGDRLAILEGLDAFREHLGGQLTVTLPSGIGHSCEVHYIDPDEVQRGVDFLQARQAQRADR